ncbi:hypothetical protein SteCoe_9051 [Stentor coeruleus]|uniref:Uncharacterized protein n=1 Tax=Stentor coeruleus TaxID=5963 RepID=A0A1R2CIT2_9CILI|nr:hypothetical protein SteCoe_9051 [Stentor coeruleus]
MKAEGQISFKPEMTRYRPSLRCITDKHFLSTNEGESSPLKVKPVNKLKSTEFHTYDISDQPVKKNSSVDYRPLSSFQNLRYSHIPTTENYTNHKKTIRKSYNPNSKASRSKSSQKFAVCDLKKGTFSSKHSGTPEKQIKTQNVSGRNSNLRSLSPFQVVVSKNTNDLALGKKIPNVVPVIGKKKHDETEEYLQPWRKYLRELSMQMANL